MKALVTEKESKGFVLRSAAGTASVFGFLKYMFATSTVKAPHVSSIIDVLGISKNVVKKATKEVTKTAAKKQLNKLLKE